MRESRSTFLCRRMYVCVRAKVTFDFFFFFFFFCWKRLTQLLLRAETTAQRYLWLYHCAVAKGLQIFYLLFVRILKAEDARWLSKLTWFCLHDPKILQAQPKVVEAETICQKFQMQLELPNRNRVANDDVTIMNCSQIAAELCCVNGVLVMWNNQLFRLID